MLSGGARVIHYSFESGVGIQGPVVYQSAGRYILFRRFGTSGKPFYQTRDAQSIRQRRRLEMRHLAMEKVMTWYLCRRDLITLSVVFHLVIIKSACRVF